MLTFAAALPHNLFESRTVNRQYRSWRVQAVGRRACYARVERRLLLCTSVLRSWTWWSLGSNNQGCRAILRAYWLAFCTFRRYLKGIGIEVSVTDYTNNIRSDDRPLTSVGWPFEPPCFFDLDLRGEGSKKTTGTTQVSINT